MDQPDPFDEVLQMLTTLVGEEIAHEMVEHMRAQGIDPSQLPLPTGPVNAEIGRQMMAQVQAIFFSSTAPVNWNVAHELALTRVREEDHPVSAQRAEELRRLLVQADLWLDPVTELTCALPRRAAWSREGWIAGTFDVWQQLFEPVAENATRAITSALETQLGPDGLADSGLSAQMPGLGQLMGGTDPKQFIEQMGASLFGMQLGQAIGGLALDALGSTDIGIPLGNIHCVALVDANVAAFAADLDVDATSVEAFLAVREAAHARLFGAAPWLRAHVVDAVRRYAAEISLDMDAIEDAVREAMSGEGADAMRNPEDIANSLSTSLFSPSPTPAQQEAMDELATTLALIEGWVAEVTQRACAPFIPHTVALSEMMRRRRASGSPTEQILRSFVGLQLRPKRARDAQALWAHLSNELGIAGRDGLWAHPSVLPKPSDLDDPTTFSARRERERAAQADVDDELARLLGGTLGYASGLEPGTESEGDESVTSSSDS
ncbi:zinc-dependent metalloprotease [Nanchangia anserum]|uniref:Zinc-dependent metalloprotease n=1 Tax=Nanchangia anserum TaxID=2692125 RepID=A0A8I0GDM1_9ACTO|nr:zinc-dependent metalloprotease [Nanchangia anserum]MBD3688932.1 zinc-dependent metalloprotease [Nanchangia anserum]QOX81198.1 zinc-dependent metalloprotease [Nanchangia anserum]